MSVNDASCIVIDDSRVMLQIVASLTDDSRGMIYECNIFIVQVTELEAGWWFIAKFLGLNCLLKSFAVKSLAVRGNILHNFGKAY